MKKDTKFVLCLALWFIGSAIVGGFLHDLSVSKWMDGIIIIFVVSWGGLMIRLYHNL